MKAFIELIVLNFILTLNANIYCYEELNEIRNIVHEIPHMVTGNINVTTYVGETVTLPCQVAHLGSYHVNWLKIQNDVPMTLTVGYQQFSRNMRYRVARVNAKEQTLPLKNKVEFWNFEIRKVTYEDQGLYECYVKLNSKHKIKSNVYLEVKSEAEKNLRNKQDSIAFLTGNYLAENPRPERLSSHLVEKIDMIPNTWIKLRCNASEATYLTANDLSATNNYDIQWFKDGKLIEQDSRRLKKWVSSYDNSNYMELELYAVDPDDSGVYQCKRDKTVLKNVVLQVVDSNRSAIIFSIDKLMLILFCSIIGFKLNSV